MAIGYGATDAATEGGKNTYRIYCTMGVTITRHFVIHRPVGRCRRILITRLAARSRRSLLVSGRRQRRRPSSSTRSGKARTKGTSADRRKSARRLPTERTPADREQGRGRNLCGESTEGNDFAARQSTWRSTAPTCNQCRSAMPARPARTRRCGGCRAERTRDASSATQWASPARVAARCLARPPRRGPESKETRKTRALCGYAKTKVFYSRAYRGRTPETAPSRCKQRMEGQWSLASSEE